MWKVLCASLALWLVLLPAVVCQTDNTCTNSEHTDEKRIQTVFENFGRSQTLPSDLCDPTLCHPGLQSSANWTFFGFGLTFTEAQTAVRVEGCHVQCLQRSDNSSVSDTTGRLRNLYALSCEDNPEVFQCLDACLHYVCMTLSGSDDMDAGCSGLTDNYQSCDSSTFPFNASSYSGPPFQNITQLSDPFTEAGPFEFERPNSAEARLYGLMSFDLSDILANGPTPGVVGVVWQLVPDEEGSTVFVPQHAVYRYFKDNLSDVGVVAGDHTHFAVPDLQCNKFTVTYRMVNTTHQTMWSQLNLPECLNGRVYPNPPTDLIVCFYNETNQKPSLEAVFHFTPPDERTGVEGYQVIVSGHVNRTATNAFLKETCAVLPASDATEDTEQVSNGVVAFPNSTVPWEILWGCFDEVLVKYFSLPVPAEETGVGPQHKAVVFDVPGTNPGGGIFYPPYSTEHKCRILPINVSLEYNETCSVDAVIAISVTVHNSSAVFLDEVKVDLSAVTNLPRVDLSTSTLMADSDTNVSSYPSPEGLVVLVQQQGRNIHLDTAKEVEVEVKFKYNSVPRDFTCTDHIDLRDRIPRGSTPPPVDNITMVASPFFEGDEVEIQFEWESPGTPCYPVRQYFISLSSPQLEDHLSEEFETNASLSGELVTYTLRTSSYRADHYNLTVLAMYGSEGNVTAPTTFTFTLDVPTEQTGNSAVLYGSIGGALGAVLVIALVGLLIAMVACCWYRRRNAKTVIGKNTVVWIGGDTDSEGEFVFDPATIDMSAYAPLDEWEIPPHEIIMEQKIADGNFGEVYRSTMAVQSGPTGIKPRVPVAVKMLKYDASDELKGEFLREIAIMKKVSQNHCPFVVNMVGCCTMQEPVCLVLEYVAHGSLLTYLRTMRRKVQLEGGVRVTSCDKLAAQGVGFIDAVKPSEPAELEESYWELGDLRPSHLISFAYQIACGMDYLASMLVIHRDLACRNILVDSDKMLKIADFGLSREGDTYVSHSNGQMPLRWMAIECIRERAFTSKSDVWAFGVTLWELCTLGGYPYPTHSNKEILETLLSGHRLQKPKNCNQDIYEVMLRCWDEDCQQRPTFASLRSQFDQMLSSKHKENYIHLLVDEEMPYYNLLPVEGSKETLPSLDSSPTPPDRLPSAEALQGSAGAHADGSTESGNATAMPALPELVDPTQA